MHILRLALRWILWGLALGVVVVSVAGVLFALPGWVTGRNPSASMIVGVYVYLIMFLLWWAVLAIPLSAAVTLWVWCVQKRPALDERPLSVLFGVLVCALAATVMGRIFSSALLPGMDWSGSSGALELSLFVGTVVYLLAPRILITSLRPGALRRPATDRTGGEAA